jgi:uncharacterized HAD superfamily protein
MDIYKEATRRKLRFATNKGPLSSDDLWDLSLKSLDALAVDIDGRVTAGRKTFLADEDVKQTAASQEDALRLSILKDVIETRQAETKAAREATTKRSQIEFFETLLQQKLTQSLNELSEEEIRKRIAELKNPA